MIIEIDGRYMTHHEFRRYVFKIFCDRLASTLLPTKGALIELTAIRHIQINKELDYVYDINFSGYKAVGTLCRAAELDIPLYHVTAVICARPTDGDFLPNPALVKEWVERMKTLIITLDTTGNSEQEIRKMLLYLLKTSGFVHVRTRVAHVLKDTLIKCYSKTHMPEIKECLAAVYRDTARQIYSVTPGISSPAHVKPTEWRPVDEPLDEPVDQSMDERGDHEHGQMLQALEESGWHVC